MCFRQEESSCHRSTSRPLLEYMWHNAVTKGFRRRRCPTHSPTYTVEQTRRFVWHSNTNDLRLCQPNATTRSPSRTRRYCLHKEVLDMATVRRFRLFRIEPRTPLVTMIELILQEEILRLFLSKIVAPCRYVHGIIPKTFSYVLHDLYNSYQYGFKIGRRTLVETIEVRLQEEILRCFLSKIVALCRYMRRFACS